MGPNVTHQPLASYPAYHGKCSRYPAAAVSMSMGRKQWTRGHKCELRAASANWGLGVCRTAIVVSVVRLPYKSRVAAADGKREISRLFTGSAAVFIFRQFAIAAHLKASSQLRHQTGISNALILHSHEERPVHYLWHIDSRRCAANSCRFPLIMRLAR